MGNENKPLEFVIDTFYDEENNTRGYQITFYYYDDKTKKYTTQEYEIGWLPKGIELRRHYNITDLYGNTVIDDRKGL